MQAEVSLEFLQEVNLSQKCSFAADRVNDVTAGADFADAAAHGVVLGDITTAVDALVAGILAAAGGNQAQNDALIGLTNTLDRKMKKLANYVTEKAQEKDLLADQINVINESGFAYNKVDRTPGALPGQVENFKMTPVVGFSAMTKIKSDSAGKNMTYVTLFHRNADALDAIQVIDNQITFPEGAGFVLHTTTDSRETQVRLSSAEKWYGTRYAVNKTGRGASSTKASVIPQ